MGLFNHTCANCSHTVSNKAKFCSACRAPQVDAWTTCEKCGSAAGAGSDFCWKCSANLGAQAERRVYDDRWIASPDAFAIRMVIRTPKAVLRHGVEVAAGTLGLLFENGQLRDRLLPGYHAQDTLWQRLVGNSQGDSVEVVLVNTRSAELDFTVHSLRDQAMIPVDARVRLEVEVEGVSDFVDTVVKQRPTLDAQDLSAHFQGDVESVLRTTMAECDVCELAADLRARERVAAPLAEWLSPVLKRHGLKLVEVRLVSFGGQALEELMERNGALAQAALRANQEQAMRRLDRQIELGLFTSELQLQEAMQSESHRYGLKQAEREHWAALWKRQAAHELTMDDLQKERQMRLAEIDRRFEEDRLARELQSEQNDHARNEAVKDARHAVQVDGIQHEQKQKKLADALETWKQVESIKHQRHAARQELELQGQEEKLRIERENKIQMAQGFQGIETQAALVASGATADQLIELARVSGVRTAPVPPGGSGGSTPPVSSFSPRVVAQVESSVALIVTRQDTTDGHEVGIIGTAFVVGKQTLATTGHQVAEVLQVLATGQRVEAIFPDRVCRITGASQHPGYSLNQAGPQGEGPVVPLNDVGVLTSESALGQPLRLAGDSALSGLGKGQRVFYVGYPVEEVKGGVNVFRPQAWFKDGTLGSITDFWGGMPSHAAQALLLNHSCPMTGGASGSPLCNEQGQVIGIVSARNMRETYYQEADGSMATGKQTSAVQTNYAQHIELLQSLL